MVGNSFIIGLKAKNGNTPQGKRAITYLHFCKRHVRRRKNALATLFDTVFILGMHCNHGKKLHQTLLFISILVFLCFHSDVNYTSRGCIHKWDIKLQHKYDGMYLSIFSSLLL